MDNTPEKEEPRAMRHGQWYWADKAVVRKYSGNVGFLALAVYHLFASMADESQTCYPSQKYVADMLGCSRRSVSRAIKRLADNKLISLWKTPGKRSGYQLLPVRMDTHDVDLRHGRPKGETNGNTNNNKEQEEKNNVVVCDSKCHDAIKESSTGAGGESRKELLAHDLAEALNDRTHYTIYLSYAKQYSESFLRRVLAETKMTPDRKIRKSRAALFNYLVYHYAGQRD